MDKKRIIAIAVVFLILAGSLFFLSRESGDVKALEACKDANCVKSVYERHNDGNGGNIDSAFLNRTREKLTRLKLTESGIDSCKSWLPEVPVSLNLIVVPDLSNRVADEVNNPDQVQYDMFLLDHIFKTFESLTVVKMNTKDRLKVDVTDKLQVTGLFRTLADSMTVDLSKHKMGKREKYFTDNDLQNRFSKSVKTLYVLAKDKPHGADFVKYFEYSMSGHIQKSTLFETYRNALIIITDGYLETRDSLFSGSWKTRNDLTKKIEQGADVEKTVLEKIRFPDVGKKFPTLEVLVLEVNERTKRSPLEPDDPGTSKDFVILQVLWKDWFKRLGIKLNEDRFFTPRKDAMGWTYDIIDEFLVGW